MRRLVLLFGLALATTGCGKKPADTAAADDGQDRPPHKAAPAVPSGKAGDKPRDATPPDDDDDPPPAKAPVKAVEVLKWSDGKDVKMMVWKVQLERPRTIKRDIEGDRERVGDKSQLVVWLAYENVSKTRRHTYTRPSHFGFGLDGPRLTDEHGNTYRHVGPGDSECVKGGLVAGSVTLEPESERIVDAIVFEAPAKAATVLTLDMRAIDDREGRARHVFRIPAAAWGKK